MFWSGVNLLREGLDLPEVALVIVLDADKEGFLRSETSLIQTAGRAARHEKGKSHLLRRCYDSIFDESVGDLSVPQRKANCIQRGAWHYTP